MDKNIYMTETINTHGLKINFGRHKDTLVTRLPVSYLKWIINTDISPLDNNLIIGETVYSWPEIAQAELFRRGTVTPTIEVSGHAIDRASLCCLDLWQNSRSSSNLEEGIHAWLVRLATQATQLKSFQTDEKVLFENMYFVFAKDGEWPVLKTVIRKFK
jgi:hypothetical protein